MTETEQPEQRAQPPDHRATVPAVEPRPDDHPLPLAELVATRLAQAALPAPVKALLGEALGEAGAPASATLGRVYLDSITVTGYRGIGARTHLNLVPAPGVTLVVGRNGAGKTSLAEAAETGFTGTNARWERQDKARREAWRNLHGEKPRVEIKLTIHGDGGRSTLTRTWDGDDFEASRGELKRPGHGTVPADQAGWGQALADYRPFLSYVDLDRMINGKPAQLYDAINVILGLGYLRAADSRLREQESALVGAERGVSADVAELTDALLELPGEDRALRAAAALEAFDPARGPDLAAFEEVLKLLPAADEGQLAELRLVAGLRGPDPARVTAAVSRLRDAIEAAEAVRATDGEDALQRAELLADALAHRNRHAGDQALDCPVCGTGQVLGDTWARRAAEQVTALRREGKAAQDARRHLRSVEQEVRGLVQIPARVPPALADVWRTWEECRTIDDAGELAGRAVGAAREVAEACAAASREAADELAARDERWRPLYTRLASWIERACAVEENKPRLRDLRKARGWLKGLTAQLREQRTDAFGDQSQRIWEQLRQESNVSLTKIHLHGSERATVRGLVMDGSVDGAEASVLSVASQGEQHSLALSLFLPRATTADSPFGFVVIDDPVQSMDPTKVHGLAQVLHELGERRQVVVFTHDTRLQRAFTGQGLAPTILQVERGEASRVRVTRVLDPVKRAIEDARALASTRNLPPAGWTHVLPGVCRIALESAFTEVAWIRHHRSGGDEHDLQAAIDDSEKLTKVAALALFGDVERTSDVNQELARLCGGRQAVDIVSQCQRGAHPTGAAISDPHQFVDRVEEIVKAVRESRVTAP